MTATYTLPAGNLQAIRAQFRYTGTASTCTAGAYNDRDDLVFTVQ
jgi:leucyl aminopeptidase